MHFFERHPDDDPDQQAPGRQFIEGCPPKVQATMVATLRAVAAAPPPSFSGGGKWEAMHGEMTGFFEVRDDGRKQRRHYRLFCVLERGGAGLGLGGPSIVVITGLSKPFGTVLGARDYVKVRQLGDEYRSRIPRSVVVTPEPDDEE